MPVATGHGAAADPTTTTVVPVSTIAGPGHDVLTTPPLAPRQYDANIFNSGSSINSLLSLGSWSAIFRQVEASLVPHAQATTNSGPSPVSVAALPQSPTTGNHHDGYSPSLIMALEHELQHSEGDCTQPRNSDGMMEPAAAVSGSAPDLNAAPLMCHKRQHHRLECDGASAKDDSDSDAAKRTRSQPSSSATVRDCCEYHDNRNYSTVFNNYQK